MTERHITACIDGSHFSTSVCDAAAWASRTLQAPLTFVHAIDRNARPAAATDTTGQIGLGAREHLLAELAELDEKRARVAREEGRLMLDAACERARADGVDAPESRQRNGELVETLTDMQDSIRLLVLGKRGESGETAHGHLGSNLERVIRSLACPILITPQNFTAPERILISFDGSATGQRMIERVVASTLFAGVECHLVYVGDPSEQRRKDLDRAAEQLQGSCASVHSEILGGEVEATLRDYKQRNAIDMLVMGAYGHSRIRQLLVGSTTTDMIRHAKLPLLIIR
ncbi:universal stress protein [Salinisphaera aquimarina]|uniref:Universal stress protein n=1 Tax=Salinisphaera aquimarina TaxID=2094031 RepID=A0ABV7EKU7_9GAMM